jgi:hypothetical protein
LRRTATLHPGRPKSAGSRGINIPGIMRFSPSAHNSRPARTTRCSMHSMSSRNSSIDGIYLRRRHRRLHLPGTPASMNRKKHGRYYTPRDIVEYLWKRPSTAQGHQGVISLDQPAARACTDGRT